MFLLRILRLLEKWWRKKNERQLRSVLFFKQTQKASFKLCSISKTRMWFNVLFWNCYLQISLKLMSHDIRNVGQPQLFLPGKIYWKKYWEKIDIDTINSEKLSWPSKIYWKQYSEKTNIDTINWEELFDRSILHKKCNIPWLLTLKDHQGARLLFQFL